MFFTFKKKAQLPWIIERQARVGTLSLRKHRGKSTLGSFLLPVAATPAACQRQLSSGGTAMPVAFIGTATVVRESTSPQSQRADTSLSRMRGYMTYLPLKRLVGNDAEVWESSQGDSCYIKPGIFYLPKSFYEGAGKPQISFKIKLSFYMYTSMTDWHPERDA